MQSLQPPTYLQGKRKTGFLHKQRMQEELEVKDENVTRVFLADAQILERSALRLMLSDLNMGLAGEATDWTGTLTEASVCQPDVLLVDFDLLPDDSEAGMRELRQACPNARVIILIGKLDARQEESLSARADGFISKSASPEHVVEHLVAASRRT